MTRRGDMTTYQLYEGNCLVEMNQIEDASIDMVCTDLPFNTTGNRWESAINLCALWQQLIRVTKPHAAIILFAMQPFTSQLVMSHPKGYKHPWIWEKGQAGNFAVAKHMPLTTHEDLLVFTRKGEKVNYYPIMRTGKLRTKGGKASTKNGRGFGGLKNISYENDQYYPTSVLKFPPVPRTQRIHSAQKPLDLLNYMLTTYSKPGDTVLDCTFGSCATGVAAVQACRNFIGIEKDKEIFETGKQWMEQVTV
jgi:site-specific DNA-methyltransferase (adenine-specific)